jgi:hypothetical protein
VNIHYFGQLFSIMTRVCPVLSSTLLQTAFVFIVIQLAVAALITLLGFVFHIGVFEDLLIAVPVFVVGLIGFFACIFWETEAFFVLNTVVSISFCLRFILNPLNQ